jgi:predicted  nucleic acid-binding Zn-ribbon protein
MSVHPHITTATFALTPEELLEFMKRRVNGVTITPVAIATPASDLKLELDASRMKEADLVEQITALNAELAKKDTSINERNQFIREYKDEIAQLKNNIADLTASEKAWEQKAEEVKKNELSAKLAASIAASPVDNALVAENERIRREYIDLETAFKDLQDGIKNAPAHPDSSLSKIAQLEAENTKLTERVKNLENQIAASSKVTDTKFSEYEAKIHAMKDSMEPFVAELIAWFEDNPADGSAKRAAQSLAMIAGMNSDDPSPSQTAPNVTSVDSSKTTSTQPDNIVAWTRPELSMGVMNRISVVAADHGMTPSALIDEAINAGCDMEYKILKYVVNKAKVKTN